MNAPLRFLTSLAFLLATATLLQSAGPSDTRDTRKLDSAEVYFPPPDSSGGWRVATNHIQARESAGIDLPKIHQAWDFTQRCTQNGGLLVVSKGWLVFENY